VGMAVEEETGEAGAKGVGKDGQEEAGCFRCGTAESLYRSFWKDTPCPSAKRSMTPGTRSKSSRAVPSVYPLCPRCFCSPRTCGCTRGGSG
jgi:hypothetical protein